MSENASPITDEQVAVFIQNGDTQKFEILMDRYEPKLFRYGKRFLFDQENLQDIVQEIFLKVYENIKSFDASQKFSPWIYRIAHNTFVNVLRKRTRNPLYFVDFDTFLTHPVFEETSISDQERKQMRESIDKGLEKLRPHYREVIILYYLEEMGYKEIADILHIPVGTVGIRLRRAKAELKKNIPDAQKYYE